MDTREELPVHAPAGDEIPSTGGAGAITVEGLVAEPRMLTPAVLGELPHRQLAERFTCEEGWSVDGLTWEGVPLSAVLAHCRPLPSARYVRVRAGRYWTAVPLSDAESALLCDRLNGEPLGREHGAPWRLVVPGGACFTSVKWVSALELTAEMGEATAERIARSRLAARDAD